MQNGPPNLRKVAKNASRKSIRKSIPKLYQNGAKRSSKWSQNGIRNRCDLFNDFLSIFGSPGTSSHGQAVGVGGGSGGQAVEVGGGSGSP